MRVTEPCIRPFGVEMNCRRCNTPIPSRSSSCPNCGQHVGHGESFIDDPGESGVIDASSGEDDELRPSAFGGAEPDEPDVEIDLDDIDDDDDDDEEELSLDDAVVTDDSASKSQTDVASKSAAAGSAVGARSKPTQREVTSASKPPPRPQPKPSAQTGAKRAASTSAQTGAKRAASTKLPEPTKSAFTKPPGGASGSGALMPDPATVRAILVQQPELVEPGLEVLTDETGREIGVQHATEVGVIDLLARDESGALVAVMVVGTDASGDIVAEALHRLGWVRKHLAKDGENVRGVVLTDHLEEQVAYAAAAVAGTLSFKSYALSLSLVDLDV